MTSIKLTYINYLQMVIKFMSSDFFVWCFIVVNFGEIWTRPYRDVVKFDEPSITRNGQSRPCGRDTLIEIDLIRLEAVFVEILLYEMFCLCTRCRSSLKMLLKLASKNVELMT